MVVGRGGTQRINEDPIKNCGYRYIRLFVFIVLMKALE